MGGVLQGLAPQGGAPGMDPTMGGGRGVECLILITQGMSPPGGMDPNTTFSGGASGPGGPGAPPPGGGQGHSDFNADQLAGFDASKMGELKHDDLKQFDANQVQNFDAGAMKGFDADQLGNFDPNAVKGFYAIRLAISTPGDERFDANQLGASTLKRKRIRCIRSEFRAGHGWFVLPVRRFDLSPGGFTDSGQNFDAGLWVDSMLH
ncbi:MAG: hypothetical protein CM1200mP39_02460 [Dehalococcoidia bacterium]|nr:MAG: hypothetical protein CM1200mP39_02460 [Dehalococcoidia bacterium]